MNEILVGMRKLQLSKVKSVSCSLGAWMGNDDRFGSSWGVGAFRMDFVSLSATPTIVNDRGHSWGKEMAGEFGKRMRGKLFESLQKEESVEECSNAGEVSSAAMELSDLGWISKFVK